MRRRLAAVVLCALLLLTGCLQSGIIEDRNDVRQLDDEPVKTVVVWHTYSDEETRVFEEQVIPAFQKAHPEIRIQSVRQASNQEYLGALMTRAAADKTPDVIRLDYAWVPRFASRGLLLPLDQFPDYGTVAKPLRERMLESNRVGDRVFGLPLNITTKAAIFNRRLLGDAGREAAPRSLMEVVELAREHHYVIGMSGIDMWGSLPYFFGLGGKLADERFTITNGYLNSEASIYAVETMLKLFREGLLNPHMLDGKGDLWKDVHTDSRVLMIDEGPWYYSILLNSTNRDADVLQTTLPAPFPSLGSYGSVIGGESLVLTKGTKVKEEAWTFLRWMMSGETQATMFKAGLIPTNTEALREPKGESANNPYIAPYLEGIDQAFYRPAIPQWNEIEQLYKDALERIFVEGENVKDALNEASLAIDARLAGE